MYNQAFVPESNQSTEKKVPYFEDATKEDGWQGQTTTKSLRVLQAEISNSVARLGGVVTSFTKGRFGERDGFQVLCSFPAADGHPFPGRINIAALPVKQMNSWDRRHTPESVRREKSLRMALYMLRVALDGSWLLEQLSPGYVGIVPFMLGKNGKTVSELWNENVMQNLLTSGNDFVEGIVEE